MGIFRPCDIEPGHDPRATTNRAENSVQTTDTASEFSGEAPNQPCCNLRREPLHALEATNPMHLMKKFLFIIFTLAPFAQTSRATVLTTLPSAMAQGGMVHIDVVFQDQPTGTFSSSLEFGGSVVPALKPLSLWKPGDTIDPVKPWYDELDPTQSAMPFGSRWGFRIDTDNSDFRPDGTSLAIRMTSFTTGLGAYFYNASGAGTFQPVFHTAGSPHDYVLWSGAMWHPYFTMPAATAYGTSVSATFEFFLANATITGDVDYTTTAGYESGYSVGSQTITWTAIPEPGTLGLACCGLALAMGIIRNRRRE